MKYVIVGCGRVGSTLAKLLVAESHEVSVVDENPSAFKRLGNRFHGHVEVGTGIDYDVLVRAGAKEADGFVAVTNGDNRNVMAALIAQRMFAIKRIVARIYDPPRGQLYRELGIDTVCPTTIGAKIIRDRLAQTPIDAVPSFDYGSISSLSVTLGTVREGTCVGDYERERRIRIAAIRRCRTVCIPSSVDLLQPGDELNVVVVPEALGEFAQLFGPTATAVEISA
ncbi:MAG TPA: TrkA family potassium uptake protein [Candidatus Baltobacteraceae bacterium]|jgi:trk system potassium uptake protein TrkA|nr:TrkA family potassium uptake protein [Candidatus Baltobacteraceae bacterium]